MVLAVFQIKKSYSQQMLKLQSCISGNKSSCDPLETILMSPVNQFATNLNLNFEENLKITIKIVHSQSKLLSDEFKGPELPGIE